MFQFLRCTSVVIFDVFATTSKGMYHLRYINQTGIQRSYIAILLMVGIDILASFLIDFSVL